MSKYAVVEAFGYVGGNKHKVISTHKNLSLAKKAARGWTTGVMIVEGDYSKGDFLWGDALQKMEKRRITFPK